MYIIIVGGGSLGYYLAKALVAEKHEVLIIEKKAEVCKSIEADMGSLCLHGDGCEMVTLEAAGTKRAGMLIAVTNDDEDNLVSCQVAKNQFNVPLTVASISNPKNETIFKKLGVDVTVNSTNFILEKIVSELPTHSLSHLCSLRNLGLEIVLVSIPSDSTNVGKSVAELKLPTGSTLNLIIRKHEHPFAPRANTIIQGEDQVIAIIQPGSKLDIKAALRGE